MRQYPIRNNTAYMCQQQTSQSYY